MVIEKEGGKEEGGEEQEVHLLHLLLFNLCSAR